MEDCVISPNRRSQGRARKVVPKDQQCFFPSLESAILSVSVVLRLDLVTIARWLGQHAFYKVRETGKPHHQPWNLIGPI